MSSTKPQRIERPNFADAKNKVLAFTDTLTDSRCSYNLRHDPISKLFNLTTVNSADSMKVLIPNCDIKIDRHDRRYAELVIEYN